MNKKMALDPEWLGANVEFTAKEREHIKLTPYPAMERVKEQLGFDSDLNLLYYKYPDGEEAYLTREDKWVSVDKKMYPVWRVKSALLLGTWDGTAQVDKDANDDLSVRPAKTPPGPPPAPPSAPPKVNTKFIRRLAADAAKLSMSQFREGRKTMGFFFTSCFIPVNRKLEFQRAVERMKAERMLEICELSVDDPARIALAQSNYATTPLPSEVHLLWRQHTDKEIRKLCKELLTVLDTYQSAKHTLQRIESAADDATVITVASVSVAHSHMAAVLWKELQMELENV